MEHKEQFLEKSDREVIAQSLQTPRKASKKRKPWWLLVVLLVLTLAAVLILSKVNTAMQARSALLEADLQFAAELTQADGLLAQGQYAQAMEIYENLDGCQEQVQQCCYQLGKQAMGAKDFEQAIAWFEQAGDYSDADALYKEAVYNRGHSLYLKYQYEEAQPYFDLVADDPQYSIPHFVEPQEGIEYMKSLKEPVDKVTVVVQGMHPYFENTVLWNASVQQGMGYQFAEVTYDEENHAMTLVPSYYPGQRIVWAWRSGDFSDLLREETRTYEKAMEIVEQAKAETSDSYELEMWLHDWICENVEYDSPVVYVNPEDFVGLDELTCVGALLDGKANCQGYTDAFYLLGTLAGFEVEKVFGTYEGEGHCWNAVRLDGRLYTVDVTFNDTYCSDPEENTYIWFNNALDINQYTVYGGVIQFQSMEILKNLDQSYYARNGLVFADLEEAVYELLLRYNENGSGMDYAVIDQQDVSDDDFYDAVEQYLYIIDADQIGWSVLLEPYKEDTYITVCWS